MRVALPKLRFVLAVLVAAVALSGGCAKKAPAAIVQDPVPSLPPEYYQCILSYPPQIENAYFSNYANSYQTHQLYDGQVFVFKDMTLYAPNLIDAKLGIVYADQIECHIVNNSDLAKLKVGDHIDLVGISQGPTETAPRHLVFTGCYVLPVGAVQLPAAGGSTLVVPY